MFIGKYKIADTDIEIVSIYETVQKMCADYATTNTPSITISISEADIAAEAETSAKTRAHEGLPPHTFPDDYLETLAVYRKLATALVNDNVLLFHGSVISVDGQAYLFTAKSGTGKSTHVKLWRKLLGDRAVMVNDDKPLIRLTAEGRAIVYGTPWDGKHHLSNNISVPLRAICWLTRATENTISPISPAEACMTLLNQTFRPSEPLGVAKMLGLVNKLSSAVKLFKLGCNMDPSAAEVAYNAMSK